MIRLRRLSSVFVIAAIACGLVRPVAAAPSQPGVILQGFYWNVPCPGLDHSSTWWWDRLAMQAHDLRSAGFTAVWLPPALKSWGYGRGLASCGYDPYDDYDLGDKDQMGTVPTRYGSREQLERCCAMMRANGIDVYEDLVENHRDPDDKPAHFDYVDAYGNPTGGRFPKEPKDFHITIGQDPDVPAGAGEIHFGRDFAPINGRTVDVDGHPVVWADYGLRQAGDWMTRALDLQGYRIDDVYGISWDWLRTFLGYGAMDGKFAVGEYNVGDASMIAGWLRHMDGPRPSGIKPEAKWPAAVKEESGNLTPALSLERRGSEEPEPTTGASAFDFPLRDGYLAKMCNSPDTFDMSTLQDAGILGIDPDHAVTFVENHDSDRNQPILQNKLLAYAFILTSQGTPCVFYRDWSYDLGCYGYDMHDAIERLIHIRAKLASGGTMVLRKDKRTYVFERTGGRRLIVALSNDGDKPHTITCQTGLRANVKLHDYADHGPDVVTDATGSITLTIPTNHDGSGYVAYAPAGVDIDDAGAVAGGETVQMYEGAQDLDIKPADDTEFVSVCRVDVAARKEIAASLTCDTQGWTQDTSVVLQMSGPAGIVKQTYTPENQGTSIRGTAMDEGWYAFTIRSFNTPPSNKRPSYKLKVRYTAPSTVSNVAESPAFHVERGQDGNIRSIAMTDRSPNAVIYYTTDGSIPTSKSIKYTAPIVFEGAPRVVAATAEAPGMAASPAVADGFAVANVPVTFRISNVTMQPDQKLYVVGNQASLGQWTIASAPVLTRSGEGDDAPWSVTVNLPVDTAVDYKYVLWNGQTEIWEQSQSTSSTDREFNTPMYGAATRADGLFVAGGVKGAGLATCPVTFSIDCPDAKAGQTVCVVGNQLALGNWDAHQAFTLTRTAGGTVWTGTVRLPPRIPIQYKYVRWDGDSPLWEGDQPSPSKNRELTTPASGTLARDDGPFGGTMGGLCACTFMISNVHAAAGQKVYVVGNVPQLGNWDPSKGLLMTGNGATWTGSANLPAGFVVQYKYVLYDGKTPMWEQDQPTGTGNRQFKAPSTSTSMRNDGDFHG